MKFWKKNKMNNEQEQKDLEELHKKSNELRMGAFESMKHCLRMSTEDIKHSGYKTKEDALIGRFKYYQSQIDTLNKEYFKKYPD